MSVRLLEIKQEIQNVLPNRIRLLLGKTHDDYLLESDSIKNAKYTADHKVDGSYGENDLVVKSVKRISRSKAINLFNGNAVSWCSDPNY